MKLKMLCAHCGSDDVRRDAWAVWSVEAQSWVLEVAYDDAQCGDCGGETTIEETSIAEAV